MTPSCKKMVVFCGSLTILFTCVKVLDVVHFGKNSYMINTMTYNLGFQKFATIPPEPYEITVVTLFIPLGKFQKGGAGNYFNKDKYIGWMETFGWLTNRLVVFVEGEDNYQLFKKIRSRQPAHKTVLVKIKRGELRSFKDYDRVSQIYSSPSYPKHHPNTVNANYSLTMNAKYDALKMAIDMGHVETKYLAWVDIGYYRNLQESDKRPKNDSFTLQVPLDFDETKIGFTEVGGREYHKTLSPWDYIRNNEVWVAGGFILGTIPVLEKFIASYKKTFARLLQQNMSSTDQQVIGAMYSPQMIKEQEVQMKAYSCGDGSFGLHGSDAQYFCLGYKCKEAAEMREANTSFKFLSKS